MLKNACICKKAPWISLYQVYTNTDFQVEISVVVTSHTSLTSTKAMTVL